MFRTDTVGNGYVSPFVAGHFFVRISADSEQYRICDKTAASQLHAVTLIVVEKAVLQ